MKRTVVCLCLGLLAGGSLPAQAPGAAEQELIALERTLGDATIKKDRATFERIYADDYVYTHSNGVVMNKAQDIADSMSSDAKWTSTTLTDLKVRIIGDVAIVTGVETLVGSAKGFVPGPRRITDIFVKRNGRWQQIGGASTLVAAK